MLKTIYCLIVSLLLFSCSSSHRNYGYVNTSSKTKNPPQSKPAPPQKKFPLKPNYPKYTVRKGDTLSAISRMSGLPVERIIHFNQLKSTHIEVGQIIYLPGVYKLAQTETVALPTPYSYQNISVVPRAHWAKYKIKSNTTPMGKVNKITVHHTDDVAKLSKISDIKFIQGIENHHRNNRKWACIGYHFIIGRDGTIYQGRPLNYQGAHATHNNSNNIGISLIGDFNISQPQRAQLNSLSALLGNLRNRYRISSQQIYGHKNLGKTECPGKYLFNWLNTYKRTYR